MSALLPSTWSKCVGGAFSTTSGSTSSTPCTSGSPMSRAPEALWLTSARREVPADRMPVTGRLVARPLRTLDAAPSQFVRPVQSVKKTENRPVVVWLVGSSSSSCAAPSAGRRGTGRTLCDSGALASVLASP